eukprot:NODE_328_length_10919_cov_0.472828.p6 type:complete len:140 gc:universal NODE_328_length_10919_cov_0.472828:1237-818(-)
MNKKFPFDVLKQTQLYRAPSKAKTHVGLGTFIPQIQVLEIRYCEHGGSSATLKDFLKINLKTIAMEYPFAHFKLNPRPCKHPLLIGRYANGDVKQVCVKNFAHSDIQKQMFNLLNAQSGKTYKIKKSKLPVIETDPRVV